MAGQRAGYWAAVLACALLVVGGGTLAARRDDTSGPDGAVRAYFAALARSDAPTALALGEPPPGAHTFLTSEVLREQQDLAPLSDVRIDGVDGSGAVRTVRYSYLLSFTDGDRVVHGAVGVTDRSGSWRLVAAAVPVQLSLAAASSRASLAGAAVPDGTVALFPGAVPIRFDTTHLALRGPTRAITFGAMPGTALQVGLSTQGRAAVRTALGAALRRCFPSGAGSGPACPLPDDPGVVPGSLRGAVDTADVARLDLAVASTAGGTIELTGALGFVGKYQELDADNIARARTGRLSLQVRASTPASGPVRLRFLDATS